MCGSPERKSWGGVRVLWHLPPPGLNQPFQYTQKLQSDSILIPAEAGERSGVAGGSLGQGHDEQRIPVAVRADLLDPQPIPGSFALSPEGLAGAPPEGDQPGPLRLGHCLPVHEAKHQDTARAGVLNDGGTGW